MITNKYYLETIDKIISRNKVYFTVKTNKNV